jgi:hypothetical protein
MRHLSDLESIERVVSGRHEPFERVAVGVQDRERGVARAGELPRGVGDRVRQPRDIVEFDERLHASEQLLESVRVHVAGHRDGREGSLERDAWVIRWVS